MTPPVSDLVKRARITADMIRMGEKIAYGSDSALIDELTDRISELEAGTKRLMLAYVNLLEIGRDRIVFLGGQCDPVDVMEAHDPALREARTLLAGGKRDG